MTRAGSTCKVTEPWLRLARRAAKRASPETPTPAGSHDGKSAVGEC
jgi:hypothetical protein